MAEIQEYLERVPDEATAEDLVIQRVMMTPWANARTETLSRSELDARVGRRLSPADTAWLEQIGAIRSVDDGFELQMTFGIASELLDLDIPRKATTDADAAIRGHMDALVDELTEIVRTQVLAPFRAEPRSEPERIRFETSPGQAAPADPGGAGGGVPARVEPGDRPVSRPGRRRRPGDRD